MEERSITDWTPSARWPSYTRTNSGEVMPTPASPLGQQFTWENGICLGWPRPASPTVRSSTSTATPGS